MLDKIGASKSCLIYRCVTCGLEYMYCPGHLGHIKLPAPIYNPFTIKILFKLLKSKCFHCHELWIPEKSKFTIILEMELYYLKFRLYKLGLYEDARKLETV